MHVNLEHIGKRAFTTVCLLVPILRLYEIKGIELSAWCLFLVGGGIIITQAVFGKGIIRPNVYLYPVIIILIGHLMWQLICNGNYLGMLHYTSYSIIMFLFMPYFFDREYGLLLYKTVAVLSSIFAIIQFITLKVFGYYLQGTLPGSIIYEWGEEMNAGAIAQGITMRPRSFFGEPSDFGAYVGMALVVLLLASKRLAKKEMCTALLFSFGLVCTRSSTGICLLAVAWGGWLLIKLKNKYMSPKDLMLCILIFIGVIGFCFTETFQIFAERTFDFTTKGGTMGRISGYFTALDVTQFTLWQLIFGHGVSVSTGFLPGWMCIWWYFGFLGIISWIWFIVNLYRKSENLYQKYVCRMLILMGFFLTTFFYMHEITYIGIYYAYGSVEEEGKKLCKF